MTEGRFPPPWAVEEMAACFIVKDSGGQALACADSRTSRAGAQRPERLPRHEAVDWRLP